MSDFENVNVKKEANIYFDGNVTSHTITMGDGSTKTLGVMLPGEYRFNTTTAEIMDMYNGKIEVKHKGSSEFVTMVTPCIFEVAEDSYFDIRVKSIVNYCCSYV